MKNRFNWIFELLRSAFFNARSDYLRGVDPDTDRSLLLEKIRSAIARAKRRQTEFPGEPQYELFLGDFVATLERLLDDARQAEAIEPLLDETRRKIIALEEDIRLHLK